MDTEQYDRMDTERYDRLDTERRGRADETQAAAIPEVRPAEPILKKKKRKEQRVHRLLGVMLLATAALLLAGFILSVTVVEKTNEYTRVIYGEQNTQLPFLYYRNAEDFASDWSSFLINLYIAIAEVSVIPGQSTAGTTYADAAEYYAGHAAGAAAELSEDTASVETPEGMAAEVSEGTAPASSALEVSESTAPASSALTDTPFKYTIKLPDGTTLTNIPGEYSDFALTEEILLAFSITNPSFELFNSAYFKVDLDINGIEVNEMEWFRSQFIEQGVTGFVYITGSLPEKYSFLDRALTEDWRYEYHLIHLNDMLPAIFWALAAVLAFSLTLARKSFLWALGGLYKLYGKLPLLFKIILLAVSVIFSIVVISDTNWFYAQYYYNASEINFPICTVVFSAVMLFNLFSVFYLAALVRNGRHALRNEPDLRLAAKFWHRTRLVFQLRSAFLKIFLLVLYAVILLSSGIFAFGVILLLEDVEVAVAVIITSGPVVYICALFISLFYAYAQTTAYTFEIAAGQNPEIPKKAGRFGQPIQNLSRISEGTRRAVAEAVRSERMKSELVTNVSHDLKTPLTSIINYVDLLKDTPLAQSGDAAEYLEVIDKKTQRLKVLIEDLFEAAKLNSGSAAMEFGDVNVVDLLKQTLGELDEKIDESGVMFITQYSAERIVMRLDGRKMWRAFENLIGNIIKYSPAGSRAYVTAVQQEERIEITFKNVSNYEMDFETSELFERFKRGDTARTTEGSGLGLCIARSIVEQNGGDMKIITDGDLFKVILLW